jgi:alpha-tubulin suppressor-like RCC1 family protein
MPGLRDRLEFRLTAVLLIGGAPTLEVTMRASPLPIVTLLVVALASASCREDSPSPAAPTDVPEAPVAAAAAGALVFDQVSAGVEHACGVTAAGRAWCWGANEFGELGIPAEDSPDDCPSRPCSLRPVAVSGGLTFRHVTAGSQFTCGVTTGDRVYCWGRNDGGQLGTGSASQASATPAEIAGGRRYRQVRAGIGNVGCAIATSRDAYCWGAGRLGNGSNSSRTPVRVGGQLDWFQLSVGANYVCGIAEEDEGWCWGVNNRGQLGNGTTAGRGGPGRSARRLALEQIDAGSGHTCAIRLDGRAFCWGSGIGVGDGNGSGRRLEPVAVAGSRRWDNVSAGATHSCGVTRAGRGFCWGQGEFGALGNGSTANRFTPAAVAGGLELRAISAGFVFSCGVTGNGRAYCWGENSNGQLGDGTADNRLVPTAVAAPL